MKLQLIAKATFFTVLMPGTVTIVVPYGILGSPEISQELLGFRIVACVVGFTGMGVLLHCIWGFASFGGGTLAPLDPPKTLVVRGLYKHTRNPMYLSVLTILLAESLFFQSQDLLLYAGIVFGCFHLFVHLYEEPRLRRQFAGKYLEYCRAVPRWGISLRSFDDRK